MLGDFSFVFNYHVINSWEKSEVNSLLHYSTIIHEFDAVSCNLPHKLVVYAKWSPGWTSSLILSLVMMTYWVAVGNASSEFFWAGQDRVASGSCCLSAITLCEYIVVEWIVAIMLILYCRKHKYTEILKTFRNFKLYDLTSTKIRKHFLEKKWKAKFTIFYSCKPIEVQICNIQNYIKNWNLPQLHKRYQKSRSEMTAILLFTLHSFCCPIIARNTKSQIYFINKLWAENWRAICLHCGAEVCLQKPKHDHHWKH